MLAINSRLRPLELHYYLFTNLNYFRVLIILLLFQKQSLLSVENLSSKYIIIFIYESIKIIQTLKINRSTPKYNI